MRVRFDSRPLVMRRAFTGTMRATKVLDWRDHLNHTIHLLFVIAASVVARNVANQQVLDAVGPEVLGKLYLAVAVVAGSVVAGVGWFGRNHDARRVTAMVHMAVAMIMGAAFILPRDNPTFAVGQYVAMEISAAALLLVFGLMLGANLGPRTARQVAARVGAGGIVGGLLAGVILSTLARPLGSKTLFLIAAALAVLPVFWLPAARRKSQVASPTENPRERSDVHALAPYGRWVACTAFLTVATTTLVDYQYRYSAERWYESDDMTAFFGVVTFAAGCTTLLFQLTVLDKLLDRLGLFSTAMVMPSLLIMVSAAFGIWTVPITLIALKLVDSGANMSVQQATGGLLLAPLGVRARAIWQGRIDGIAKSGGKACTGFFLAFFPLAPSRLLPLTLVLCALWITGIIITRERYIRLLTSMLSAPRSHNPEIQAYDGATIRLLESELVTAGPARAGVILTLLEQAEHRAPAHILEDLLDQDPRGMGALLVIDHLTTMKDAQELAKLTRHENANIAGASLLALDEVDPASADRAGRRVLAQKTSPEELKALAAGLLADHDPGARATAAELAQTPNPDTRLALAQALSRLDSGAPKEIGDILCYLAQDDHNDVARAAVAALGHQLSPEACGVLLRTVTKRPLRGASMRALAELGTPAVKSISLALNAAINDPPVASALTWSLGQIGSASALAPLLDAVSAPTTSVRLSAAVALNSLKRRRPNLELPAEQIKERFLPEIAYYSLMRDGSLCNLPGTHAGIVLKRSLKQRAQASLETLFRLLSLVYLEESIQAAFQAITARDRGQRQLALELLDTLLDKEVRARLAEAIGASTRRATRERNTQDVLGALAQNPDAFLRELAALVLDEVSDKNQTQDPDRRGAMKPSMVDQILELQSLNLFNQASAEDLADVASLVVERRLGKGESIFHEGEPGDAMYLIREGSVLLTRKKQKIDRLGPGEAIGILSVLDRLPRELTATATSACTLLVLKASDLQQLLADRPLLMHSIFRALTESIRGQLDRVALGKRTSE